MTWPVGTTVHFQVLAIAPVPKGSHKAFVVRAPDTKIGYRAVITDEKNPELKEWESRLRAEAGAELERRGRPMLRDRPCEVQLVLCLVRPRGDFSPATGKLLGSARLTPWVKPDVDKLQRTIFDALTSCVIDDDSRIVRVVVEKRYVESAAKAGVAVRVIALAATVREEAEICARSSSSTAPTAP